MPALQKIYKCLDSPLKCVGFLKEDISCDLWEPVLLVTLWSLLRVPCSALASHGGAPVGSQAKINVRTCILSMVPVMS